MSTIKYCRDCNDHCLYACGFTPSVITSEVFNRNFQSEKRTNRKAVGSWLHIIRSSTKTLHNMQKCHDKGRKHSQISH